MKNKLLSIFLAAGWILLIAFLSSAYFFNNLNDTKNDFLFTPIAWENHMSIFEGAISCSLTSDELVERREFLKEEIFSKQSRKVEHENGYTFYFDDNQELLSRIFELVEKEKACCPFFKFDVSILPFHNGIALQVTGSTAAKRVFSSIRNRRFLIK